MCILHKWSKWKLIEVRKTRVDPITREYRDVIVDSQERVCAKCGKTDREAILDMHR